MNDILVSIITVVYNGEKYLKQTIDSVLNQSYENIEYIIVDGASTDGTLNIIEEYNDRIDTLISEPDNGLYDAMNKGIKLAKGELIGMINSDDWYELDAVKLIVDNYRNNPSKKIFHGDRNDVLENGTNRIKKFHPSRSKFIYYGMTYNHPSMFVHKSIYLKQLYNIHLKALSDYEFVLKNLIQDPANFSYLPIAYVNYRLDGLSGGMSTKNILKEGYIARKNGGLSFTQNIFSYVFRLVVRIVY
ncbi:glycosyltransferase family 2 protein [Maribacter aquivivus]|uniref:glycosyltransferase family 2 protein n=1 Tax=Maribacter aquivivus TaxID=228958 RepID=UPI00248FD6B8|nr:glycosyltransferase family 2 protein [Maribacter aquivivus]